MPLTNARRSVGATSGRVSPFSRARNSSPVMPAASAAPTTAPIDVPTMCEGVRPFSRSAFQAPTWARDFTPPPEKTATTLLATALIEPVLRDAVGPALHGPLVAALF